MRYLVFLFLLLWACKSSSVVDVGLREIGLDGYSPFPTARTGDKPGTIYRKSKNGDDMGSSYKSLPVDSVLRTSDEEFVHKKYAISNEGILSVLGFGGLAAKFQARTKKDIEIFLGSAKREYVNIEDLNSILKAKFFQPDDEYKYYIIGETISVDTIAIKLIRGKQFEAEDSADIKSFKGKGYAKFYHFDTLILHRRFPTMMRILYRPLTIKESQVKFDEGYKYEVSPIRDSTFFIMK